MRRLTALFFLCASAVTLWAALAKTDPAAGGSPASRVQLKPCRVEGMKEEGRCGIYEVYENRKTRAGKKIPLKIIVIPARNPHPDQGPIFYMAGGPGETATELTDLVVSSGDIEEHEVVIMDQRGTGEGHWLDCKSPGSDDNLEAYLDGPFDAASARTCRDELSKKFDLSQYTTPNFADDLEEVREAMGYDKININAGSFGTYAAQIYMRRHGEHVRTAYLTSLVTLADRVPLYHARSAQAGLDQLFKECDEDSACRAAYPKLRENFATLLIKAREQPIETFVHHPVTGARTKIHLSERAFADAIRVMMYRTPRDVPYLIERAAAGDFNPFAEAGLRANRGIYSGGRIGLHYCITCNEFVSRIRADEIDTATQGSYLGSWRVRAQMAACNEWPKSELPPDYFEPFQVKAPTLVVSGANDPASRPPNSKEIEKSYLPNAVQIVVPGAAHTPENPCIRSIRHQLFRTGTTDGLDIQCVSKAEPPPFKLPDSK